MPEELYQSERKQSALETNQGLVNIGQCEAEGNRPAFVFGDEDQIGASYPELEWAMNFESDPRGEEQLSPKQKEILRIYRRLHTNNRHKMEPIPVFKVPDSLR